MSRNRRRSRAAASLPVPPPEIDGDGPPAIQRTAVTQAKAWKKAAGGFVPDKAKGTVTLRGPRVSKAEWADPDDAAAMDRDPNSPGKRRQRRVRGYRVMPPVEKMHIAMPREITERHVAAAARFLDDFEAGVLGAQTTGGFSGYVDGGGAADMSQGQLDAIRRYHHALDALGPAAGRLLGCVVIHGMTCEALAASIGSDRRRVVGRVQAALERLSEHYDADAPRGRRARPGHAGTKKAA